MKKSKKKKISTELMPLAMIHEGEEVKRGSGNSKLRRKRN